MKTAYEPIGKMSQGGKGSKTTAPQSNQAALTRMSEYKSSNDVTQFKVGMEFQTFGGKWNIKKLKPGADKSNLESDETNFLRKPNPFLCSAKQDLLIPKQDFNITSDGPDFEYITKAYDETTEKAALVQSASAIGAHHRAVSNLAAGLLFGKYLPLQSKGVDYYINKDGEISAHPQATMGVRCESIEALFQKLANEPGEYLADSSPAKETDIGKKNMVESVASTTMPPEFSPTAKGFLLLAEESIHGSALSETIHFAKLLEQTNTLGRSWNQQLEQLVIPPFQTAEPELSVATVENLLQLLTETCGKIIPQVNKWMDFTQTATASIAQAKAEEDAVVLKGILTQTAAEEETMRTWFNDRILAGTVEVLSLNSTRPDLSKQLLREHLDYVSGMMGTIPLFSVMLKEVNRLRTALDAYQKPHDAFKYTLPIKERTSLKDLFCLLSPEERVSVKAYLGHYPPNILIVREKNATVKLSDWLASLPDTSDGTDVVDLIKQGAWSVGKLDNAARDSAHPDNHGADYFKLFGIIRSTDIGQDKAADPVAGTAAELVHGVIVELRDMKRHVQPEDWGDAAAAVADAAQILNHKPPVIRKPSSNGKW